MFELMKKRNKKGLDKINLSLQEDIKCHLASAIDTNHHSYDFLKKCFDNDPVDLKNEESNGHKQSLLISEYQPTASSDLGTLLLKELLDPTSSDLIIKVKNEYFFCHRSILSARCEYFSAMLSCRWNESSAQQEIALYDIKEPAFAALLCYLYGATSLLPGHCLTSDLLHISDMFGTKSVTAIVELGLSSMFCHGFNNKPCIGCISNYADVIKLASAFSLTKLYANCIKWNCVYFMKLWPTHKFASLSEGIHESCVQAVVSSLTISNAVHYLMETDMLLSNLTRLRWTLPVISMATEVMTSCIGFLTEHFLEVTENKTISVLFEGMGWKTEIVQQILAQLAKDLSIENVCSAHLAIRTLTYYAEKDCWIKEFNVMLQELKNKIMDYLISNYYAVIHTEPWHLLNSNDKTSIKTQTLCVGDETRKLSKRPVFTSSLKKPKKTVVSKSSHSKIVPKEKQKRKEMTEKTQNVPTSSSNTQCNGIPDQLSSTHAPPMITMSSTQEVIWVKKFEDIIIASEPMRIRCN